MFFINVKSFILQWGKGSWDMKKMIKAIFWRFCFWFLEYFYQSSLEAFEFQEE